MSNLSDDELSLVLEYLTDKYDRKSFSEVCKQWLRVEGITRLSIRVIDSDLIPGFIPRYPNLLSFSTPYLISNSHIEFVAKSCPKLQVIDLNVRKTPEDINEIYEDFYFQDVGKDGIVALAKGCPNLTEVILRERTNVTSFAVVSLVEICKNLTNLDLGRCNLVDDQALEAIACSNSIRVLNLEGCLLITDHGLSVLVTGRVSKTLKKLILQECLQITDSGVSMLNHVCYLEELNLSDMGSPIMDSGGLAVASLANLVILNLAWSYKLSDVAVVAIATNCVKLVSIDLTGCLLVTGVGVRAFEDHGSLEYLALASCYRFDEDDLSVVVRCESLIDIVLDRSLMLWISREVLENINEFWCRLHWR